MVQNLKNVAFSCTSSLLCLATFLRHAEEQSMMIVISFAIAQAACRLRATEGSREIYTTEKYERPIH